LDKFLQVQSVRTEIGETLEWATKAGLMHQSISKRPLTNLDFWSGTARRRFCAFKHMTLTSISASLHFGSRERWVKGQKFKNASPKSLLNWGCPSLYYRGE
jgi:hypothetical protein